jgi:hypothetical protein
MTTDQPGNDLKTPSEATAGGVAGARELVPGDWAHVDYQGRDVLGMIDRLQDGLYTFAYWDAGVLRFGSAKPDRIGARDEPLTAQFRAAIAVDPHHLTKYLALWTGPSRAEPRPAVARAHRREPRYVQQRLFPE